MHKMPRILKEYYNVKGYDKELRQRLPDAYRKFWNEWKATEEKAVHFIPEQGKWKRDEFGKIIPVQNVPIPLIYPDEYHEAIWGGEAIVKGYVKKGRFTQEISTYWIPKIKREIVYSEVLDKHLELLVTDRALDLIDEHYGFDFYLLKTLACDLKSLLAIKIKREILLALVRKTCYQDNPEKQQEILEKYKEFIVPEEEAEWYGLTVAEAAKKLDQIEMAARPPPQPLKIQFRKELIQELKEEQLAKEQKKKEESSSLGWASNLNPFKK